MSAVASRARLANARLRYRAMPAAERDVLDEQHDDPIEAIAETLCECCDGAGMHFGHAPWDDVPCGNCRDGVAL